MVENRFCEEIITADDNDRRLDRWLRERAPGLQQSLLEKMLRKGDVKVGRKKVKAGHRLMEGDSISFPRFILNFTAPQPLQKQQTLSSKERTWLQEMILYEDEHVVVLNKPSGLAVQGGSKMTQHLDHLLDLYYEDLTPRLVHRLDKDTSGVLLVAKTAPEARRLTKAFAERAVQKTYWALVVGNPTQKKGVIDKPLSKLPTRAGEKVRIDHETGVEALTQFCVMQAGDLSWLELKPKTGRMHQLRVHCAEVLKTPIVGDGKYGGTEAYPFGRVPLHLHARALTFPLHAGEEITVTADLPEHMQERWGT